MALSTRNRKDEDEEILQETEEVEESSTSAVPAVSDRRRRRMIAQGLDPDAIPTSTAPKGRPTPAREDDSEKKAGKVEGNIVSRFVARIRDYFGDVRGELLKVAWPTREEVNRLTRIVLAVTALAAVVLGAVSFIFGALTSSIADANWGTLAGLFTIAIIIVVAILWLIRDRLFPNYE